jgi:hypothetical protein
MSWEKLEPMTQAAAGLRSGCLTCGPQPIAFPRDAPIAVGFGSARVMRGDREVWSERGDDDWNDWWTGADAERAAAADPDHDWRIVLVGPLSNTTYQRQDGDWVLVEKGPGFA